MENKPVIITGSGHSDCLPPMWPRFDSRTRSHMWVAFVVVVVYLIAFSLAMLLEFGANRLQGSIMMWKFI